MRNKDYYKSYYERNKGEIIAKYKSRQDIWNSLTDEEQLEEMMRFVRDHL